MKTNDTDRVWLVSPNDLKNYKPNTILFRFVGVGISTVPGRLLSLEEADTLLQTLKAKDIYWVTFFFDGMPHSAFLEILDKSNQMDELNRKFMRGQCSVKERDSECSVLWDEMKRLHHQAIRKCLYESEEKN